MSRKEGTVANFNSNFSGKKLQKTKAKLKKESQGFNFQKLFKFAVFFLTSNFFTYCRAVCPGETTSPTEIISVSTRPGALSNKLTNRGYSLTQSKIWKRHNWEDDKINGIELTYSSDCCGLPDIDHMYGSQSGFEFQSKIITSKVIAVKFMHEENEDHLLDIWFTLADGSTAKTCHCRT